jgi:hypothetical protein
VIRSANSGRVSKFNIGTHDDCSAGNWSGTDQSASGSEMLGLVSVSSLTKSLSGVGRLEGCHAGRSGIVQRFAADRDGGHATKAQMFLPSGGVLPQLNQRF